MLLRPRSGKKSQRSQDKKETSRQRSGFAKGFGKEETHEPGIPTGSPAFDGSSQQRP
jgi:hypothetical protein